MPDNADNRLSFFQELKRRKVVRVIMVYAAASFVILELASIIQEPFGLPDWTIRFVFIILLIGLIISIILSWIYDITPGGGIVKTEPAHKVKPEDIPKTSNSWKIASYISFVVIVVLMVLNIIPRLKGSESDQIPDRSIAVLPFESLSDDPEKQYLADGVMEDILLHLSKIEDLRVMASTSVQQYRNTDKTATEICHELGVSYILEGRFQKYGDQARLIVQLIQSGQERHAWANDYNREWTDIFAVQSEVAQAIARELHTVITPEVQERIEKIPTSSLTAYEVYQKGQEEYWKYYADRKNITALERAEDLYRLALEYDPAFAKAYTGLASIYWLKGLTVNYNWQDCLDSVLIFANNALAYDNQLADAYHFRANYYRHKNMNEQAIKEFDKALKLNPNSWMLYNDLGFYYLNNNLDYLKSLENFHKAASLIQGPELSTFLRRGLCTVYGATGFLEKFEYYNLEALRMDGDSVTYYLLSGLFQADFGKAIDAFEKVLALDTSNHDVLFSLGYNHMFLGQYRKSLAYFMRFLETDKNQASWYMQNGTHRIGYVFWKNGYKEESEWYFEQRMDHCYRSIELGSNDAQQLSAYYDLAGIHAFRGEQEKAYENLRKCRQKEDIPYWMVRIINKDPLFDNIRDEPEFQQIVNDIKAKFQAKHDRVRKWLEENDML